MCVQTAYSRCSQPYALPVYATYFSHNTKLIGSDSVPHDWAGHSVAVSADNETLIFGAPQATVNGVAGAGKVYVFTRNTDGTWSQQTALIEPGTPGPDGLGASVALSADGNTAVIGASAATVSGQAGAGEVYVYTRSGSAWSEQTFFSDPTPAANDEFGEYVTVSGDAETVLVGAPFVAVKSQSSAGAVFAYTESNGTWSAPAELTASDAATKNYFGAVALSANGNTALIRAKRCRGPREAHKTGAAACVDLNDHGKRDTWPRGQQYPICRSILKTSLKVKACCSHREGRSLGDPVGGQDRTDFCSCNIRFFVILGCRCRIAD